MTSLDEALTGVGAVERPFHCPVHNDKHASASVNAITGLWICYTCGAKGKAGDGYTVNPDQLLSYLKGAQKAHAQHYFPESWLNLYTAGEPHEYWRGRFSVEACEHFQLGYDEETESATYPLRDTGGHLLGVVRRPLSPSWTGGKYIYPKYVDVTRYLFNYNQYQAQKRVVLVEGAADAIAAWEAGYEAYAIFGSRMTEAQAQLLRRVSAAEVWTCFDNDEAGEKCHRGVVDLIKDIPVRDASIKNPWLKDLGEMNVTARAEHLAQVGKPDHERVVSTTCESRQQTSAEESGRPSSSGTSRLGRLRISRTRK